MSSLRSQLQRWLLKRGVRVQYVGAYPGYLARMYERARQVEGDIVECGVGKLYSFTYLASFMQSDRDSARSLWGFDSFDGFPEPSKEDSSPRNPQKGEWKYLHAEDVIKFLDAQRFDRVWLNEHIQIEEGFFADTLPSAKVEQIALLHLDVDLYDSYRDCLTHLFPKVVSGGVVLFDEYANKDEQQKWPGAKKAIDEYFFDSLQTIERDTSSGKYYLIKK